MKCQKSPQERVVVITAPKPPVVTKTVQIVVTDADELKKPRWPEPEDIHVLLRREARAEFERLRERYHHPAMSLADILPLLDQIIAKLGEKP